MRPTRSGLLYAGAAALTFFAAASSGNNLLYLLFGALAALAAVAAVWGRLNIGFLRYELGLPERVFQGRSFALSLTLERRARLPSYQLRLAGPSGALFVPRLGREGLRWSLETLFPFRGRNRLSGLAVESRFPLGLWLHRLELAGEGLALPAPRLGRFAEPQEGWAPGASVKPRKGVGEELYGIRDYNEADDPRLINWKVTARAGRPMVNEFAERSGARVVLRAGLDEESIARAASAAKYFIESGSEVNVVTPEGETGPGKGFLHLDRAMRLLASLGEGKTLRGSPAEPGREEVAPPAGLTVRLFYITAALVWASLFLVEELSPRYLALMAWVFPAALWLDRRPRFRPGEAWWRLPSTAMLVYGMLFGWRLFGVSVSTVQVLLYILACRLLSAKGPRELGQAFVVCFLGFFLACGLSSSMWFPFFFLAYLASSLAWLLSACDGPAEPAWGGALAGLLALTLPLGGAVFALTPRFEPRRFGSPLAVAGLDKLNLGPRSMMGFTEDVTLGFFGELKRGSARAMRVRPESGGAFSELRLRGAALDVFDGARWSKSRRDFDYEQAPGARRRSDMGRAWLPRKSGRLQFPATGREGAAQRYEFFLYPLPSAAVFTVGDPEALETEEGSAYFDFTGSVSFATPSSEGRRYAVRARRGEISLDEAIEEPERFLRGPYLAVPRPASRIEDLARRITRRSRTPLEQVRAVEAYLRDHYDYSLFMTAPQSLEAFLFDTQRGNCEYFATAGAVLLRELGIPTRLVTGFLSTEWNPYGRFYDVRQSDAHAWLEAYVSGRGWVTVDPTARVEGEGLGGLVGLRRSLDRFIDAWRLSWYRDVVGFDPMGQRELWQRLQSGLGALGAAALAALGLAALWSLAALFARGLGGRKPRVRPGGHFYLHMLGALERTGLAREGWQTGREFARAVAAARPPLARSVGELTDLHYLVSYAGRELGPQERLRVELLLRELRAAL